MDTLNTFHPTLDGPAKMQASTCLLPSDKDCPQEDDDEHDAGATERDDNDAFAPEGYGNDTATARIDAAVLPEDLPAEYVIGVQEETGDDAVNRLLAFQQQIQLAQEHGKRLCLLEQRRQDYGRNNSDEAMEMASKVAAEKALHIQALVDLRQVADSMGPKYHATLEEAIMSSEKATGTPTTLYIKAGKPLNMFSAAAWAASFVQFMYGDCAPNLDRPRKVGIRELFHYLMSREELEYHLPSDKDDPAIPGGK